MIGVDIAIGMRGGVDTVFFKLTERCLVQKHPVVVGVFKKCHKLAPIDLTYSRHKMALILKIVIGDMKRYYLITKLTHKLFVSTAKKVVYVKAYAKSFVR